MIKCILKPIFREQGIIQTSRELEGIKKGQNYIAVSSHPTKIFSFLVNIMEVEITKIENTEQNLPVLEIDSRRLGPMSESDLVNLYLYNTPVAEKIEIGVLDIDHVGISEGDWSSALKSFLLQKSLDYGDSISCAIEIEEQGGKSIRLIRGILIGSYTKPAVKVGLATICELKKLTADELQIKKKEMDQHKMRRARTFLGLEKQEIDEFIGIIKTGNFQKASENLEFQNIDGKMLNGKIQGVFAGFEKHDEKISDDGINFSCTQLYVVREKGEPVQVIEYQLVSSKSSGNFVLNVYSRSIEESSSINEKLVNNLIGIHPNFKRKITLKRNCPECGSKLPMEHLKSEDVIICERCGLEIKLD